MIINEFPNNFFIIFLFLGFLFSHIISVGKDPHVQKLNDGNYIVVSSIGISFFDSTLSIENEDKFVSFQNVQDDNELSLSTTINQFSEEDGNYIIVLFQNNLYIFDSNEIILTKEENIPFIESNRIHSIISYNSSGNEYYFAIIYYIFPNFNFVKTTYNSYLNEIIFSAPIIYENRHCIGNSFSCQLMYYNNQNIINCIYL